MVWLKVLITYEITNLVAYYKAVRSVSDQIFGISNHLRGGHLRPKMDVFLACSQGMCSVMGTFCA